MSDSRPRTGGCLCKAVRYEVRGTLRPIIICHCGQCRRMMSHVMAASAARRRDFRLKSAATLTWFESSPAARRGFCARCGSSLFWQAAGRDYISISAGTLDEPADLTVAGQLHVADRAPYDAIGDAAPQVPGGDLTVPWP